MCILIKGNVARLTTQSEGGGGRHAILEEVEVVLNVEGGHVADLLAEKANAKVKGVSSCNERVNHAVTYLHKKLGERSFSSWSIVAMVRSQSSTDGREP